MDALEQLLRELDERLAAGKISAEAHAELRERLHPGGGAQAPGMSLDNSVVRGNVSNQVSSTRIGTVNINMGPAALPSGRSESTQRPVPDPDPPALAMTSPAPPRDSQQSPGSRSSWRYLTERERRLRIRAGARICGAAVLSALALVSLAAGEDYVGLGILIAVFALGWWAIILLYWIDRTDESEP